MDYLAGIDLGSTSLKAMVYDLNGNARAQASRPPSKDQDLGRMLIGTANRAYFVIGRQSWVTVARFHLHSFTNRSHAGFERPPVDQYGAL